MSWVACLGILIINQANRLTVIFHTNAGSPVLASDMLLSVPGPGGYTDLRLPSQPGGITIPANTIPSYVPIRMRRKIFVVNDHLAVGAAGYALHVSMFIEDLTKEFRNRSNFTYAEITQFLNQYALSQRGAEASENIGALILVEATDWSGSLTKSLTNYRNIVTQRFGRVVTIGSGSDSIIEEVNRFENDYSVGMSQLPDDGARFPEFRTLAHNLQFVASVYWKEVTSPTNVFEGWGGAYDLIYQDARKAFQYLNDYTIVLRLLDVNDSNKGIQLMNVLKYERRPEVSFVVMLNDGKLDFFGAKDITAPDSPTFVQLGKGDLTMNSKIHISIIAVGKENRYLPAIIQIEGLDPTGQVHRTVSTWFDDQGRLCVWFRADHDEWLKAEAMSYYESRAHKWSKTQPDPC